MGNLFSDHLSAVLWAGALLGVVYGMIAQWSRFCLLRGLFNRWQQNDSRRLRAFALAMAVALISSQWLAWYCVLPSTKMRTLRSNRLITAYFRILNTRCH